MLSAPHLTATPSCLDEKSLTASELASFAIYFAMRRRKISPTAIGRKTPFVFFSATVSEAEIVGATKLGSCPLLAKLTNFVTLEIDFFTDGGLHRLRNVEGAQGTLWMDRLL